MPRYLELEVSLQFIKPRIWRRLLLHESARFQDLNDAIQDAMGWRHAHLWGFSSQGEVIAEHSASSSLPRSAEASAAATLLVSDVLQAPGQSCRYTYDFGDGWEHRVELRRVVEEDAVVMRRLLAGARACPPEDCGGPPGYEDACAVARGTVRNPDLLDWLGGWTPEGFSLEAARQRFDGGAPAPAAAQKGQGKAKATGKAAGKAKAIGKAAGGRTRREKGPTAADLQAAAECIALLLDSAPPDPEAVIELVEQLHRGAVQQQVLALLAAGIPPGREWVVAIVLETAGVAGMAEALVTLVEDGTQELSSRAVAFAMLAEHVPGTEERLDLDALEDVLATAAFLSTRDGLVMAQNNDQGGAVVVEGLSVVEGIEEAEEFLELVDAARMVERLPALAVYGTALAFPELAPYHPLLLARIAAEDNPISRAWLAARRLPVPLQAVESIPIPELPPADPQVWLTACNKDGQFSIVLAAADIYGTHCVLFVDIEQHGGLLDGGVLMRAPAPAAEELREEIAPLEIQVPMPAGLVAPLLATALSESALADAEDEDLMAAVAAAAAICGLLGSLPPVAIALPPPAATVTLAELQPLLQTPDYQGWFLNEEDLKELGLKKPPKTPAALKRWTDQALRALQEHEPMRMALAGGAEHMALLHHLRGDDRAAAWLRAAAAGLERDALHSPLAEAMVLGTPAILKSLSPSQSYMINPATGERIPLDR